MSFNKKFKILTVLGMFIISSMLAGCITRDENDAVKTIEDNLETKTLKIGLLDQFHIHSCEE